MTRPARTIAIAAALAAGLLAVSAGTAAASAPKPVVVYEPALTGSCQA